MIISNKYKYVFIELPRTGTTAISQELCDFYGGERIFEKHSKYSFFKKNATLEQQGYFIFSCLRNPLDRTVSLYFHLNKTVERAKIRMHKDKTIVMRFRAMLSYCIHSRGWMDAITY